MKFLVLCLCVFVSSMALSATGTGRVDFNTITGIKINDNGDIQVKLKDAHSNPGNCGSTNGFYIEGTNQNKDQMLSLVLYAKSTGSQVTAWIVGCTALNDGNKAVNLEVN